MTDEPEDAAAADGAGDSSINSQIVDAMTAVNAMLAGHAPASAVGMLGLVGAQTIGLGMHNAVARQQTEATTHAAAIAAACAQIVSAGAPFATPLATLAMSGALSPAAQIAAATANAKAAIAVLQAQLDGRDAADAADALAAIMKVLEAGAGATGA